MAVNHRFLQIIFWQEKRIMLQLFSGGAAGTQPSEGDDRIRHGEGADKTDFVFYV
jgi:hypothetical protein